MPIDQLIVLLALVVLANLVLLAALVMPRLAARRGGALLTDSGPLAEADTAGAGLLAPSPARGLGPADPPALPTLIYERVVRVVSYLFIGSALLVVTVTGTAEQPLTYIVLALGAFLIVVGQDILPLSLLGRWRYPIEAAGVTVLVSLLILLTGGYQSPFFFGYLLLLAGGALWAGGYVPFLLAVVASGAYLLAIALAPSATTIGPEAMGMIAFNLVALALISYVAAVVGREQHRARDAALNLSRIDDLTRLYSRGFFNIALDQEVRRALRSNRPFGVMMIDLDGLKAANDEHGHAAGDRLLQATAGAIREGIRASDIAARLGGDEFAILLPDTDQKGALNVAHKLRLSLLDPLHQERIRSSASIGLAVFPMDGRNSRELLRRADLAQIEAKRRGGNQVMYYPHPEQPINPGGTPPPWSPVPPSTAGADRPPTAGGPVADPGLNRTAGTAWPESDPLPPGVTPMPDSTVDPRLPRPPLRRTPPPATPPSPWDRGRG